ncbi:MAG TPA: hypothetical protein VF186_08550 [Gaiellaceae bacterium]
MRDPLSGRRGGGTLDWRICVGYGALTMRRRQVVTTIYTSGDVVYGFGLSRPAEPVCV